VQPQAGLVLYLIEPGMADYEPQSDVVPGLRVSSSMDLLRDIAKGKGPRTFALFLGRASWAPGQLEQELAQGVWLPTATDTALLFRDDAEGIWRQALESIGADPAIVASTAGEA
jgi:putative transcriptional regulator